MRLSIRLIMRLRMKERMMFLFMFQIDIRAAVLFSEVRAEDNPLPVRRHIPECASLSLGGGRR
ncbi:hypothetical protein ABH917_000955 [Thermobifida halotolerans]